MVKRTMFGAAIVVGVALLAALPSFAGGLARVVDDRDTVVLNGNVHPLVRPEFDAGAVELSLPMERMILALRLRPDKQAQLDRLLVEQQDPASPNFHRWLTPEEFGERFGPTPEELSTVTDWLESHGFVIEDVAKGRTWINFSGTVADVERAFHTQIHRYFIDGEVRQANAWAPAIPRGLSDLVAGVVSLHNFPRKPMNTGIQPAYTGSSGTHAISPGDFAIIYNVNSLYSAGFDGTGRTIGIVARTHPATSNWTTFRSTMGLSSTIATVIVNGTDPGDIGANEDGEADLDCEWSGGVAKGASVKFVVSKSTSSTDGVDLSAQYIVNNNLTDVMSTSFGQCESSMGSSENTFYNNLWSQAASEGITSFVSTGDSGAAGCNGGSDSSGSGGLAVSGLASTPYNVAVGGTEFSDPTASTYWNTSNSTGDVSAKSYIPEIAWNESGSATTCPSGDTCSGLWSSSGGASSIYTKPSWQVCTGVPTANHRYIPDWSFTAASHDGYLVETQGALYLIGGTSASSPASAGVMAIICQKTGSRQGNANTRIYQLANAQYASGGAVIFHDTTSGNNSVPGLTGFSCTTGYDEVTGVGSVDVYALANNWVAGTTYSISGTVSGDVTSGVTVNLTGASTASTTTGTGGTYTFSGLANGSYTVTPSLSGYTFSPTSTAVTISGANQTGINCTATAVPTYSLSGTVSGDVTSGVTINLTGAKTASTTTGTGGTYTFSGLANGSYTVTPSLTGYTFSPTSTAVTISSANQTGINFTATAVPTYSISGTVSGAVTSGVTINLTGAKTAGTTTGTGGTYTFSGLANGSYTVTPSLSGYSFNPNSTAVTVSNANQTGINFTSTQNSGPTTLFSDGFESSGWSTAQVSGTAGAWTLVSSSSHPSISAHGGTRWADFNSYTSASGSQTRLYRSSGFAVGSYGTVTLTFWMYHDTGYSTYADKVQAQVSTNGTTWTNVGSAVNRYTGSTGWAQATVNLSAYAGQTVYLGFLGVSAYGNDEYLDDVLVTGSGAASPDFAISASPTSVSAKQGASGTTTVTTTVSGGFSNAISLSASGLPTGATATFNPTSIAAPGSGTSTLTLTAGASTTVGTYTVTITGTGGGTTHTTTVSFSVTSSSGPTTLFSNGFESSTGWSQVDTSGTAGTWSLVTSGTHPTCSVRSGSYMAKFNSYTAASGSATRYYRTSGFAVASSYTTVTLTFWMYHDTGYSTYADKVQAQVSTNGTTWTNVGSAVNRYTGSTGWSQVTIDLSSYKGQTMYLAFLATSAYGNNMYLDDATVTAQ